MGLRNLFNHFHLRLWVSTVLFLTLASNVLADEAEELHQLFESEWERTMQESPTWASQLGDKRYNRVWADRSADAIRASARKDNDALQALSAIDKSQLSPVDQLNYRLFEQEYKVRIAEQPFKLHLIPLNQRGGVQNQNNLSKSLSFETVQDYEEWIVRLNG